MNNSDNTVPVHLVLGGGGVRCLSYAGALRFLVEHGISFASVSACSAGTFLGALLCAGLSSEQIEREIDRISLRALAGTRAYPSVFSLLAFLRWPFARLDASQDDVAESVGMQIMTNHYQQLSKEVRNRVFISYVFIS